MSHEPTAADLVAAYALDAIDHASSNGEGALDYSPESVARVEAILEKLHGAMPRGLFAKLLRRGPSKSDIETMAKMYGSYVGEVIRRNHGGHWSIGPGGMTLAKEDAQIWPIAKTYKRLVNGPEENVQMYYQSIRHRLWPKDPEAS